MKNKTDDWTYLALGGNIGDTHSIFLDALSRIKKNVAVSCLEVSDFYITKPVDCLGGDFLNAVCRLKLSCSPEEFFCFLEAVERDLGKQEKAKNASRLIDIDFLFFGEGSYKFGDVQIPHPRWRERIFVVRPLLDLTKEIILRKSDSGVEVIDLKKLLNQLERGEVTGY